MKPLLTVTIPVVATLFFVVALVLVNGDSSTISPTFNTRSPDRTIAVSKLKPVYFDQSFYFNRSFYAQPLQPGVYQTYPYTIIIIESGKGIDERSIGEIPNANSIMPMTNPRIEVVPRSQTGQ